MLYSFCLLVVFFFLYSFLGYLIEVISVSRIEHKIELSRGYLIGPYLPIFGFGAICMILLLSKYKDDLFALFILSMTICCLLEYFTSLVMENIFHLRWWDYSNKKFNINGRVCLENGIFFGMAGVFLIQWFHPFIEKILLSLTKNFIIGLGITLFIIILVDFILSTYMVLRLHINYVSISGDATKIIRKEVIQSLEKYQFFLRRYLKSYPYFLKNGRMAKIKNLLDNVKNK